MTEIKYYWEDFKVGEVLEFGNYEVTKQDIIEFATEYDPQVFHTDEDAAKNTFIGTLCASGWHTSAMLMRMLCDEFILNSAGMGAPGVDDCRWRAPVRPGDILRAKRECLETRPSESRPEMGITKFRYTVTNQDGEQKMIMEGSMLLGRRVPASVEG